MTFSIFSISIIIGIVFITCKTNMSGSKKNSGVGEGNPKEYLCLLGKGGGGVPGVFSMNLYYYANIIFQVGS